MPAPSFSPALSHRAGPLCRDPRTGPRAGPAAGSLPGATGDFRELPKAHGSATGSVVHPRIRPRWTTSETLVDIVVVLVGWSGRFGPGVPTTFLGERKNGWFFMVFPVLLFPVLPKVGLLAWGVTTNIILVCPF